MPLHIVNQDLTAFSVDAIVNPTNSELLPTGGLDAAIHKAAGGRLYDACRALRPLAVGEAKATPAFSLPCRYVIHTVGPLWCGGDCGEKEMLVACYQNALKLAVDCRCESVAFPLIASGALGFPKEIVLKLALSAINGFLTENEMTVYLAVYDKSDYAISRALFSDIVCCLDEANTQARRSCQMACEMRMPARDVGDRSSGVRADEALVDILRHLDQGFAETLFAYIDARGITDVECYKRANVDKKTFSKIKCNPNYRPAKQTVISFAIGLHLTLAETYHLLETVGMTLSKSIPFDAIILYFIKTGNYKTIHDVNEVLYQFDQATLGC